MKFGVREICDVVLKAKATQKVGNTTFSKGEPVIYFDTLKTSSMEGAATTVYAQGGRGNSRLVAWEGERTVTFTMEDALISPLGFMILSGAGLVEAAEGTPIQVHATQTVAIKGSSETDALFKKASITSSGEGETLKYTLEVPVGEEASEADGADIYVMLLDENGEIFSAKPLPGAKGAGKEVTIDNEKVTIPSITVEVTGAAATNPLADDKVKAVLVDYYIEKKSKAQQIEITPDKFGGNYYLEASTLFRTTEGVDMPAEFIIPNCKIQSNFTFTMASSGDPSSFTFTMDAFPDYTKFDLTKKVLAAIQIVEEAEDPNA